MGCRFEESFVRRFDRSVLRTAVVGALMAALGLTLSACGRRGPPEAPPGVYSGPQGTYELDSQGRPIAGPGQKKRIPLDVLLD
jgi:predicted small lipoprotein YifL